MKPYKSVFSEGNDIFYELTGDGLYIEKGDITIAASDLPDDPGKYMISWHKGEMPAYKEEKYDKKDIVGAMKRIAPLNMWQPVERDW